MRQDALMFGRRKAKASLPDPNVMLAETKWDARYCAAASGIAQVIESMGQKAEPVSLAGQVGTGAISLASRQLPA
jgi:hypothetical protein